MSHSSLLDQITDIAVAAGQEILAVYHDSRQPEVSMKDDNSPLTDADRRAHRLILQRLEALTPEIPVLSEESDPIAARERLGWRKFWLVDPLDGTREFVSRNGEFTVNIALIENGQPLLGVVHVPVTGVSYGGDRQGGAWVRQADGRSAAIACSRLSTEQPLRVVASRRHGGELLDKLLKSLEGRFAGVELVNMGSSLKICLLAEGKADLYPRLAPTSEWDTAAAHAVLAAAGGTIVDTAFKPLVYNQRETVLNPHFIALADPDFEWGTMLNPLLR